MGLSPFSWPPDDPSACRVCARCEAVLVVTPRDELECPRCGRVKVWAVSVNGRVVAAGRDRGIWLAGRIDDLRPGPVREPAGSRSGWKDEN